MIDKIDRLQELWFGRWITKFTVALFLVILGYQLPKIWIALCFAVWAAYTITLMVAVYFIKNGNTIKTLLSLLANISTAALISAVIVFLHLYRMAYGPSR